MKTFVLNGNVYAAKELDFNLMCELEEQGLSLEQIEEKPMSMIRSYIAFCMDSDKATAGNEINAHVVNGGTLDDVLDVMMGALNDSGFFRAQSKGTEKKTTTRKKAKAEKVVEISEV